MLGRIPKTIASQCPLRSATEVLRCREFTRCAIIAHSAVVAVGWMNEMNSALSPVREREATLAFDKPSDEQAALIPLDSRQIATERRPPDKSTAPSLLSVFFIGSTSADSSISSNRGRYRSILASSWMVI